MLEIERLYPNVRAPPVNKRCCDNCLKIQKNQKTPPQSPYDPGQGFNAMRKVNNQILIFLQNFDF